MNMKSWLLVGKIRGFPGDSEIQNPAASAGDTGDMVSAHPRSGRSPGGGDGNPLQYSCLEIRGQRSLAAYGSWGCRAGHN